MILVGMTHSGLSATDRTAHRHDQPCAVSADILELDEHSTGAAYTAMKELRPGLKSPEDFLERVAEQRTHGYRLIASLDADGNAVAVLGFRLGNCLARGRHLHVDDLSTMPRARRRGHAGALLRWIDAEADRLGCEQIHLDSGKQRHEAHRRYHDLGYEVPSLHFSKRVATG